MDVVRAVLISDPRCLLWRNEIGTVLSTHFPDGSPRPKPRLIQYGLCNPGGADLCGCFGPRLLAVETKTVRGRQNPDQIKFERWITARGNVYAIARGEADARALLAWLTGATPGPFPAQLRGQGHTEWAEGEHQTTTTAT